MLDCIEEKGVLRKKTVINHERAHIKGKHLCRKEQTSPRLHKTGSDIHSKFSEFDVNNEWSKASDWIQKLAREQTLATQSGADPESQ